MAGCINAARRYLYGLEPSEYQELLEKQRGKCAACGDGETVLSRSGGVRRLSVDHCHETGKIRGLLCDRCNNILGRSKDSPSVLRRLAAYLEVADTGRYVPELSRVNRRAKTSLPKAQINVSDMLDELSDSSE